MVLHNLLNNFSMRYLPCASLVNILIIHNNKATVLHPCAFQIVHHYQLITWTTTDLIKESGQFYSISCSW